LLLGSQPVDDSRDSSYQGGIVRHLLLTLVLVQSLILLPRLAHASETDQRSNLPPLKMSVAVGLGFLLCPDSATEPELGSAFNCSGLATTPVSVELELINKPAAKPQWLYYEANYTSTETFVGVKTTVELLVMYAKYDGITSGFIDGRLTSVKNGVTSKPVYFRTSAVGGLDHLTYSSTFGETIRVKSKGAKVWMRYMPNVAIDAGAH
jgi:hypothetical protein